ncbi:hypothetical protein F5144DRAFT_594835 [Chaetomium tenue]|uniref:Uncharacterized protein n=1 Tax=Chaetomium tenue TaxID=1854479 RepID=A0ACB7P4U4_9PEZI|nr:hypothetical protein F5144DRAFT_594835 [Chaetomium globosum]
MVTFSEIFTLLPTFCTAVCPEHGSVVTARSVASHVRQRIVAEALALQDAGSLAADTNNIPFPDKVVPAIDGLPVWSDGKKRKHIQKHCRLEHGWANPRGRGGKPGAHPAGGLGEAGALQRLFEVTIPANAAASGSRGEAADFQAAIRAELEAAAWAIKEEDEAAAWAIKEEDEAAAALISDQSRLSANKWLRRTGWPRHLRGFDREWLVTTTRRPAAAEKEEEVEEGNGEGDGEDEEDGEEGGDRDRDDRARSETALAIVLLAVERVIWRAQKASQVEVVGSAAVNYIERREVGGETNEKPFNAAQKGTTMAKYSESWKSLMAYIWRTWRLEPVDEGDEDQGEEGEEDDGYNGVYTAAYTITRSEEDPDTGELEGYVLDFFIALLDHDVGDNEYQNALYSGLAILGIQPE